MKTYFGIVLWYFDVRKNHLSTNAMDVKWPIRGKVMALIPYLKKKIIQDCIWLKNLGFYASSPFVFHQINY